MLNLRNLSVVVTLTFLLTVYLRQVPTNEEKPHQYAAADGGGAAGNFMKKIVAYSLKKRMEIERAPIACNGLETGSSANYTNGDGWNNLSETEFHVFSVHVDRRLHPYDYVRVLGMAKGSWNETLFCNLHSKSGKLHVTRAIRTDIWAENWVDEDASTNFKPVLMSCQMPTPVVPLYIHLSKIPCRTTTKSLVLDKSSTFNQTKRSIAGKRVTICVKPLNFKSDISERLAEWILINEILGADKIQIYVKYIHAKTRKFLNWYEQNGGHIEIKLIKQTNIAKMKEDKLWQKRKNEVLIYNHCFYDNLDSDYVLPIDIDEVVIPKHVMKWQEIFENFPEGYASYLVRNAYFLLGPNRGEHCRIFKTYERTIFSDLGESGKSFVSTRDALTVFNHYSLHVLRPGIGRCYFLDDNLVQMNHYKETCPLDLLPECVKYLSSPRIYDNIIVKYKELFEFRYYNLTKYYNL